MDYNTSTELLELQFVEFFMAIKEQYSKRPLVFLSKRFFQIYKILLVKHPEILNWVVPLKRGMISSVLFPKVLFVNDILYELPSDFRWIDEVVSFFKGNYSLQQLQENCFPLPEEYMTNNNQNIFQIPHEASSLSELKIKNIQEQSKYYETGNLRKLLTFLEEERQMLERSQIQNTVAMLPNIFQEYFRFYLRNEETLHYYLETFYERDFFSEHPSTEQSRNQLREEVLLDMTIRYGNMVSQELIEWLCKRNTNYYDIFHVPIQKEKSLDTTLVKKK